MSKGLAQELASRNITVNCVAPGFIHSAMTDVLPDAQKDALLQKIPAGKLGEGQDIAAAVAFLASAEAAYITGQTRSEEHTSELQSLMRISYAVFCLKKKTKTERYYTRSQTQQSDHTTSNTN